MTAKKKGLFGRAKASIRKRVDGALVNCGGLRLIFQWAPTKDLSGNLPGKVESFRNVKSVEAAEKILKKLNTKNISSAYYYANPNRYVGQDGAIKLI
jgi:hypothetical protein